MLFSKLCQLAILSATSITGLAIPNDFSNDQVLAAREAVERGANPAYKAVYAQGDPGQGIGGYDLLSTADRAFAFDYDGCGKTDHLVFYRPGTGLISILKNYPSHGFSSVFTSGSGVGGYDLLDGRDRIFAFDYDHSGKLDHLVLYRAGTGTIWILGNNNGNFYPVYQGSGIGSYDLLDGRDQAFAFDYDHSGKLDHLVLYRAGTGTIWIVANNNGAFSPVYQGGGIGSYDLLNGRDQAFAFDYDHSGKLDHIVLYRPGDGTIWIIANNNGNFSPVYQGSGIGGYDLRDTRDRVFALDFNGTGRQDFLALYRPGTGTFWIVDNENGNFVAVYAEGDPGDGIGGYDLASNADVAFAYDFDSAKTSNFVVLMRPGQGAIFIVGRS